MNARQSADKASRGPHLNGDAREHAALLRTRGFALCKPNPAEKKPTYPRWGTRSKEAEDFGPGDMIGVLGGPLSDANRPGHAAVVVDLDTPEAVEQADDFLPPTGMEDGRPGKPRSHRYYLVPVDSIPEWAESPAEQSAAAARERAGHPGPLKKAFHRPDTDQTVIDFIGTGGQAVCPPSVHPSGEHRAWVGGHPGEPATVPFPDLWLAVCRLAEACGCKPASGTRWPWEDRSDPPRHAFIVRATGSGANVEARAVAYLAKIPPAVSGQRGHARTFYAARVLVYGFDLGPEHGFRLLKDFYNARCEPAWTDRELWHKAEDADRLAYRKPRGWLLRESRQAGGAGPNHPAGPATHDDPRPIEAADDPHRLARLYLERHCQHADGRTLQFWRQEWHRWGGSAYHPLPEKELRAELTAAAKAEMDRINVAAQRRAENETEDEMKAKPVTRKVTARMIADVAHALASLTVLPSRTDAPTWVGEAAPIDPAEVLACRNGLVNLPALVSGRPHFFAPTPRFFSPNALDFDFRLDAPQPTEWLKFLHKLWPGGPQSIDMLQEWFGYQLTPDTRQQKMLLLVGPKRSGKGTIARVLRGLIGNDNVAGPTLASLGTNFGLWPLLSKTAAIISDARLSGRTDTAIVTERLLSISGEDAQTVDRKNLVPVTVKLAVRFSILTNELPRLGDASGALTGRMLLLRLTESWYGKEDIALTERLLAERPAILLWAIAGWQRLRERGHFIQPDDGRELLDELHDLSSPVGAFVRECCRTGPGCRVAVADLFAAWKRWCEAQGRKEPGTEAIFGRDLIAAVPTLRRVRPRDGEDRYRAYEGIGLR